MREIGAYEAKRHGRAVAELAPVGQRSETDVRRAIKDLRVLRDELARRGVSMADLLRNAESVRELAHEAHRY